ncbi:MAG: alanyl-tRNA editing protein [Pseudomonadota bacterium]
MSEGAAATALLFRDDAYLRAAEAVATETLTVEIGGRAAMAVALDRTPFYAAGGGQPGDAGLLRWEVGEAAVETTVKGDPFGAPGAVLHILSDGATPPGGGTRLQAEIDWERRFGCMRVHTALHLLSVVLPLPVTGGQIGPEKGRLDFDMPEPPGDKAALEARLNALIAEDHPVAAEWITDAELDAKPELVKTMAVQPPRGDGRVRLVRIGAGEAAVDLQPCGGTHVRSTAEIGAVRLGKVEKKGKQNRRVTLLLA